MKLFPYIHEPARSIEVHKKTEEFLDENPKIKNRIEELGWIYHTIGMIIPQTKENFWSGHYFPFKESWQELQISFNLVCFGLYKQSFVSLRSGLELGLLSVYYNINDEGHKTVQDWLNSKDSPDAKTPRANTIWKILLSNSNIKDFNNKHNLEQSFKNLGYLHNFVHSKGEKYSNSMGLLKSNFQTFEEDIIPKWIKSFEDIISLVCTLHLLKYPISVLRYDYRKKFGIDIPNFGGLEEYHLNKISKILPEGYLIDIEKIAEKDTETQTLINKIDSMPDVTTNQIELQVFKIDKMSIEHGEGFEIWLENQKRFRKEIGQTDFSEKMKTKIKVLEKWAKENNFMGSKSDRIKTKE